MKLKKLLISASTIAVGSSLIATVLTSCSKEDIDEDLMIDLDDDGKLVDGADFHDALKNALGRSSTWGQFKSALADEIVYQWYVDRASKSKSDTKKNRTFRKNLDSWEYDVKKDYNKLVDNSKSKYGANWKFYFQNEHLAPNGGTEEAYKHYKLVDLVKEDFIKKVFNYNYFGYKTNTNAQTDFPIIYTNATANPSEEEIKNPSNWDNFGFFAKTNSTFKPQGTAVDTDYLAKNPDGDYATIQDYVFNRWFRTEKPFFSAAALFKYSNPAQSGGKLDNIYNADWATIPENPNEAFPFFGAVTSSNGSKGTQAFWEWYQALLNAEFEADGKYGSTATPSYNGTITIDKALTEDSQTLLLCTVSDMFTSLYTPYAVAASNLYEEMLQDIATPQVRSLNKMTQIEFNARIGSIAPGDLDDSMILNFFFYKQLPTSSANLTLGSYLDLSKIYPSSGDVYHCPLFKKNDNYTFLYGDTNEAGVKIVTNSFEVPLKPSASTALGVAQPWILEMNESGVHAQTIDGYQYVRTGSKQLDALTHRLKQVVMYRLMEDKCYDDSDLISANLFGSDDNAKLKKYFKDNFADIILEMALRNTGSTTETEPYYNVFREIDSYDSATPKYLLKNLLDSKWGTYQYIYNYLTETIEIDRRQKVLSSVEAADSKIYEYRKTQIENSKSDRGKKRFENGLLAPMPLHHISEIAWYGTTHHYQIPGFAILVTEGDAAVSINRTALYQRTSDVFECNFITSLGKPTLKVDTDIPYSPQVAKAKDVKSNRFWYNSPIIDKVMYSTMSSATLANAIKQSTYQKYTSDILTTYKIEDLVYSSYSETSKVFRDGVKSSYMRSKLLSGDNNYATYTTYADSRDYYTVMDDSYKTRINNAKLLKGEYNDEALNEYLFLSTVAYLSKNNFEKLYDVLSTKIHENELAYVAYVNKYDYLHQSDVFGSIDPMKPMTAITTPAGKALPFEFNKNVDNIFDYYEYSGSELIESTAPRGWWQSFDQYWNVITRENMFGKARRDFAGFMGIQSASSNQFDSESGLKDAATKNFEVSTYQSPADESGTKHIQNDGVLFPWAFNGTVATAKEKYGSIKITDPRAQGQSYSFDSFADSTMFPAIKLAYNIGQCSTIDDLKSMARSIADAILGSGTIFDDIAEGRYDVFPDAPEDDLKYVMVHELMSKSATYANYFMRLKNVELHTDNEIGGNYAFRDTATNNCFKIMLTQLNKSDLTEKLITPEWKVDETTGKGSWDFSGVQGITPNEFWWILFNAACDSTNQQSAIADAVKTVYGEPKLIVHDAQLYNQFDSTWIKDWKKKTMGE